MPYATTPNRVKIAYQLRGGKARSSCSPARPAATCWDDVREDFHAARSTITIDYRGTGDQRRAPNALQHTTVHARRDRGAGRSRHRPR